MTGGILGKDKTTAIIRTKWATLTRCATCEKQHAWTPKVKLSGQSCQVVNAAQAVGSWWKGQQPKTLID